MKIKKSRNKKTIIILIAIFTTAIVVAGGYLAYALTVEQGSNDEPAQPSKYQPDKTVSGSNSESKTKTEDSIRETNTDHADPAVEDPATKLRQLQLSVSANISNDTLFVRGGIDNSVEYNGTCYATLTGPNGESIRKDTSLLQNASTTDCMTIQIPLNDLAKGKWKITLNYNSTESKGVSDAYTVEI